MQENMQNFPPTKSSILKHLSYMLILPQTDRSDIVLNVLLLKMNIFPKIWL